MLHGTILWTSKPLRQYRWKKQVGGFPICFFLLGFWIFYEKKKRGMHVHAYLFLVPLTGLEPVRILLRGILSPLCLPIPPQRRCFYYTTRSAICQGLFEKNLIFFLFLQIPCISSRIPPLFFRSNRFYIHEPLPCSIRIHSTSRKNQPFYLTNQNRHAIITLLYNTVILE